VDTAPIRRTLLYKAFLIFVPRQDWITATVSLPHPPSPNEIGQSLGSPIYFHANLGMGEPPAQVGAFPNTHKHLRERLAVVRVKTVE
jgi:hypothetical protein